MNKPLLELQAIEKSFFGIPVLKRVSLQLDAGQTLGLVGENGAGKSTLMNVLGGVLQPEAGQMNFDGESYQPRTPRDATAAGVAFIHQELNLFPNLSIAQNLFLTNFPRKAWWIDHKLIRSRTRELSDRVGLHLPPAMLVERLSPGERQLVEMAKALNVDARLIILDEPTTSLSARETERLFTLLKSLRDRGIAMIYISHALADVQELCEQIVVLRDGQVVGSGPISEYDNNRVVSLMVGRQTDQLFPNKSHEPTDEVALSMEHVSQPGVVHDISLRVRKGEVLGLSGLMGSGRTELARILFGLDPMSQGRIMLSGQPIEHLSTRQRIGRGMAMLTESRRDDGLCMLASIADNMSLVAAGKLARRHGGLLHQQALRSATDKIRSRVRLTAAANSDAPVQTLSGGNQQKVVLAKWLLNEPKLLILDEPTRGIDVGAKFEIYGLINELAAGGAAVIVISSELEELLGICDRILVIRDGEIQDELTRPEFDRNRIMRAALQADTGGDA